MSNRTEELASEMARYFDAPPDFRRQLAGKLQRFLDQYGQEVREAAAKAADSTEDVVLAVEAIREMPLP